MAAKDCLDSGDIKKQEEIEDITTCSICTEVYTDPKALPCIHTFCMKCLRQIGLKANKGPGDKMSCPICRRQFKIPQEGFPGLQKHFFIERLIQVSKVSDPSAVTKTLCSVCLKESNQQAGKETPTAFAYCVECKHKLCEECCSEHKNHKLIPTDEHKRDQDLMADLAPRFCEVHEEQVLEVFCTDCKTVVCATCFTEDHKSHEGSHVNKCSDDFRKQIENNTEAMNECMSQAKMRKAALMKVREDMQQRVESLECEIQKRKDEIKQLTDEHANCLRQDLCAERQSRLKELQMETDDIDAYISNLKSYNSYCKRIINERSVSDICREFSGLSVKATALQQQNQTMIERENMDFKFCFRQCQLEELLEEDCGNLIGEIEEVGDMKPTEKSKQILLAEQSKEMDIPREENEELRNVRANNEAHMEKLKQDLEDKTMANNALKARNDQLMRELEAEKTNNSLQTRNDVKKTDYEAHIRKLEQEMEVNKTASKELQDNNDKLKQELDAVETTNNSLESTIDKFVEQLSMYKATVKALETMAEKLRKELETSNAGHMTNDEMKRRIKKLYVQFISDVDPDLLGDYLKQENVLSIDVWMKITAHKYTAKEKCRAVLDNLLSSDHPSAFLVIRRALKKIDHHLLETIDKEGYEVPKEMESRHRTANKESFYNKERLLQDEQLLKQREKNEGQLSIDKCIINELPQNEEMPNKE